MTEVHVYERVTDPEKAERLREEARKVLQSKNPTEGSYSMYVTPAIIVIEKQR